MNLNSSLKNVLLEGKLFDLANTPHDLDKVARAADVLQTKAGLTATEVKDAVHKLISIRSFYGQFCEFGAYDWLDRHNVRFHAQVPLAGTDVLNANGCVIDGQFMNMDGHFDIKAMGFQAYLASLLEAKVQQALSGSVVTVDGPMDVAIHDIDKFALAKVKAIAAALSNGGSTTIRELNWIISVRQPAPIVTKITTLNPFRSAEQNCYYPFKTAGQFARNKSFVLVFAYAGKFNLWLAQNFGNSTDTTLRALARRVFMRLTNDSMSAHYFDDKVSGDTSIGDAAKLISGLLFINLDKDDAWLYLNPRATHVITDYHVQQLFNFSPPVNLGIDDFKHDNY